MEKIKFMSEEMNEEVDFYVLEQTKVGGVSYILVTMILEIVRKNQWHLVRC